MNLAVDYSSLCNAAVGRRLPESQWRLDPTETIKVTNEAQTIRGGAASHMRTGAGSSIHTLCVSVIGVALVSVI